MVHPEIRIDPEFKSLISPLRPGELATLETVLVSEGCRDALVVWDVENVLLDGHNRYEICNRHNIPFTTVSVELKDRLEAMIWIRRNQAARRNLTDDQRAFNALGLEELLSEKARIERAMMAAETRWEQPKECLESTASSKQKTTKERSRKQAANTYKVSERRVKAAKKVKKASPDLAAKVIAGDISLAKAQGIVRQEERKEMVANTVDGKFAVILSDPPWSYDNSGFDEGANSQYPTMSTDSICVMSKQVKEWSTDSTVLFLWATNPMLLDALRVMKEWGYTYKTNMAWVKDKGRGKGWFLKSRHELVLIGVKSNTPQPLERPDSAFEADRPAKHSQKPEISYSLIESMYSGPRLEMFSRQEREGWTAWGNEVNSDEE